ncbi:MAG: response regulator transcription factor [Candidatus Dormibacteria bacterium]
MTDDLLPHPHIKRVVIVDDHQGIRAAMAALLTNGGLEIVGEGTTGAEAIDLASALQPDLIILDDAMPNMIGADAIPVIRDVAPGAKIVLHSASCSPGTLKHAPDALVTKGGHPRELLRTIAHLLGSAAAI